MNSTTPGMEKRNNCELVTFTKESTNWLAVKVTALEVQEGEQLLTRYGGRKVVSTADLRHTIQPANKAKSPNGTSSGTHGLLWVFR